MGSMDYVEVALATGFRANMHPSTNRANPQIFEIHPKLYDCADKNGIPIELIAIYPVSVPYSCTVIIWGKAAPLNKFANFY